MEIKNFYNDDSKELQKTRHSLAGFIYFKLELRGSSSSQFYYNEVNICPNLKEYTFVDIIGTCNGKFQLSLNLLLKNYEQSR